MKFRFWTAMLASVFVLNWGCRSEESQTVSEQGAKPSPQVSAADSEADTNSVPGPSEGPAVAVSSGEAFADAEEAPHLVGKQVCRECHSENFELHAVHGHASTFGLVQGSDVVADFDGKSYESGEPYGTYEYHADASGNLFVKLQSQFGDKPFPLQYGLGSSNHALTFLTLVPSDDGTTAGVEHRVSSFHGRMDLTPGHKLKTPQGGIDFFGDTIRGENLDRCIYCHTTSAEVVGVEIQNLVANVNCEKCHGPGSEHVRQARASKTPPPYSVGKVEWDTESEIQLCGDCHRLPAHASEKDLREYSDLMARFQPIGMLRSACYLESNGEMKCSTCHNPHRSVSQTSARDYIETCVQCHQEGVQEHTVCPVNATDGCIECHMPALNQDSDLVFHDHWIRVRD